MNLLLFLVPISLFLGALGLVVFLWCLRSGQYEDLDGAAVRVLFDEKGPDGEPLPPAGTKVADPNRARSNKS